MNYFSEYVKGASSNIVYQAGDLRISLMTERLIRVEKGKWTDLPTQTVWNRDLGPVEWELEEMGDACTVRTARAAFLVDKKRGAVTAVVLADGQRVTDFSAGNLLGTARTLDGKDGAVELEPGIMSRSGASVMDDSKSLLLQQDGSILPRQEGTDRYWFAYGHDYLGQLKDFFGLTGPVPLIPKFALGNWWSRYYAYTQEGYRTLMKEFLKREIPISVATIDMDWHWTDVMKRFGSDAEPPKARTAQDLFFNTAMPGWTGYSWNTELFPDHKELLGWLHENNFRVPLNVHPSQGIRCFEDCYADVCAITGTDPETKAPVVFNITDPVFRKAYFEAVHHPMEKEGVDFWWLDWQQGTVTDIPGLDPLWALNHYHTLDMDDGQRRPLILSRYAGLGSHRYPLGFSGDTIVTWASLDFQPYFTNTASNAGYTWWSHDIGGHMKGIQDDELYLRWLQYGVFTPINRLHSSSSEYIGKEPWKRSWAVEQISYQFLRLRQKLIPYLYAANHRTHTEGEPLCMPMYYRYDVPEAYQVPNQYLFGGQLMVCPITKQMDKRLNMASVKVWLPEGRWTDLFYNRVYQGGRRVTLHRDMDAIPVLAGEGAIVPMYRNDRTNDLSLEQPLEIHIWRGNGHFDLYEDDGETMAYASGMSVMTTFCVEEKDDTVTFTIQPPADGKGLLPESRAMYLRFRDIVAADMTVNGAAADFGEDVCVMVGNQPVTVELKNIRVLENIPREELRSCLLTRIQGVNSRKNTQLSQKRLPAYVRSVLEELEAMYR